MPKDEIGMYHTRRKQEMRELLDQLNTYFKSSRRPCTMDFVVPLVFWPKPKDEIHKN
jgi:hypothetical protein